MEKFEFKSQTCTSRSQSERLLALGLKPETADMVYMPHYKNERLYCYFDAQVLNDYISQYMFTDPSFVDYIPAWSLGRLIKDLMPQSIGHLELAVGGDYAGYYEDRYNSELGMHWEYVEETPDMFDNIISTIEWLIKEGYFKKDYLEEKK